MVGPISGGVSPLQGGQGPQDSGVTSSMFQSLTTVVQSKDSNGNGVKEALQNIAQTYQGSMLGNEAENAMYGNEDDFISLKDNLLLTARDVTIGGIHIDLPLTLDQSLSLIQTFVQPSQGGKNAQINIDIQQYEYSKSPQDLKKIREDLAGWIPQG